MIAALAILPSAADEADDAVAALQKGELYALQRLGLFRAGWRAAPNPAEEQGGRCSGHEEICAAYPETDYCAGTGLAPCNFRFSRPDGTILIVSTQGEPLETLTLTGWEIEGR